MGDNRIVYVITDVEAGWDCVRGVYEKEEDALKYVMEMVCFNKPLPEIFDIDETPYIIHEKVVK